MLCLSPFLCQCDEIHGSDVTFTRDIAPILYRHCVSCHRPGQVAPFPLLTWRDAARRAELIARVTDSRYMPPWKPAPGYGHFQGQRRLSDAELSLLLKWAAAGAPEGDPKHLTPPPHFHDDWRFGAPDLEVEMPQPFAVAADGPDQYQCFVLPLALPRARYVRAFEFRPGNRKIVHHALLFVDSRHTAREHGASYSCFGAPGFLPTAALGGWTPGSPAVRMPEGTAVTVAGNADLVVQIHFHPTGKPETEQSRIGLYFTDTPPSRRLVDVALGSNRIDIPPGVTDYKVTDGFELPVDVDAVGIIPHAHYICKDMKGYAILPDGRKEWLLWIKDWDFNWQEHYRYAAPARLPAGSRLEMEFTYDNSTANPNNPNHPPRRVLWGPETTDEMAGLHVQVIPARTSDLPELMQALWGKFMRSVGGGFYRR